MMNYRNPACPRCKTNVNVVRLVVGYRCAFCSREFLQNGQQTLNIPTIN